MTNPPVLLGESLATRALSDSNFFNVLPEYSTLKMKMQTMKADLTVAASGCSGCRKRRVVRTLFSDFLSVTLALSGDGLARLKTYLGTPSLLVNRMDPSTGKVEMKIL
jgi:hypothetical protein